MKAKKDCSGKPVTNSSRVKWIGGHIDLSRTHKDGYKDVYPGDKGNIVNINHKSGEDMVLVLFDGHKEPISVGLRGIEKV